MGMGTNPCPNFIVCFENMIGSINPKFLIALILVFLVGYCFATSQHDLELAQRYLVIGKYEEAKGVLERLLLVDPGNIKVQGLLVEAYKGLKDYDGAVRILNSMVLANPDSADLWVDMAECLLAQGKSSEAMDAVGKAMKLDPYNQPMVVRIHGMLSSRGYIDEDIKFIKKARKSLKDDTFLSLDLARLYEIKGDFSGAVKEYTRFLKKYPDRFIEVERRLSIGDRTPDELRSLKKALNALFSTDVRRWQTWRLISVVEQQLGEYDKALDAIIEAEKSREPSRRGNLLATFIVDMLKKKQFKVAYDATKRVDEINCASLKSRVPIFEAKALRGLGKFRESAKILENILDSGIPQLKGEAAILLAEIYLENLHDTKAAERALGAFPMYRRTIPEQVAVLMAKIRMCERKFDEAKSYLVKALNVYKRSDELFYLYAFNMFFAGVDDTAEMALHAAIRKYPDSRFANDGVEYLLVLQEAGDGVKQLREALFDMFTHDTAAALDKFNELTKKGASEGIMDMIYWKKAQCQLTMNDSLAYETLYELVEKFPESFYAPLAMEIIADRYVKAGENAKATKIFSEILEKYPDASNLQSVRQKLLSLGGSI